MNDKASKSAKGDKKAHLTRQFMVSGLISVILIVTFATIRGYYSLRTHSVRNISEIVAQRINDVSNRVLMATPSDQKLDGLANPAVVSKLGMTLKRIRHINTVDIFGMDKKRLWSSSSSSSGNSLSALSKEDVGAFNDILENPNLRKVVVDESFFKFSTWFDAVINVPKTLPLFVRLSDSTGRDLGIVRLNRDYSEALDSPRHFGFRLFLFASLAALLLFFLLYFSFRRGVKTIERQEEKLNQQIARLSNLLVINKNMQTSIKTASARAVELNEQFLRRVGADLHDGPAQMIGYAVLRLNNISQKETAKQFGPEFHAVKEALDESLDEIRGISSGLVLPELEQMSLEECLRKVITLHGAKSDAEVSQFYQDLPEDIPLPIKICAYRFLQEGLNNAHRHGSADKCRVSAYLQKDELVISLKDNGVGFRKSALKSDGVHLGLSGLKDRIASLGGNLGINSELGVGTSLKLSVLISEDD